MPTIDIKKMHLYQNQVKTNSRTLLSSASDKKIQTKKKPQVSLLLGAYKSGKSSYACDYALSFGIKSEHRTIIATSRDRVDEVTDKCKDLNFKSEEQFTIIEENKNLDKTLKDLPSSAQIVLVDNIVEWLSNLVRSNENLEEKQRLLLDILSNPKQDIVILSNIVELTTINIDEKEKKLLDLIGTFNQEIAKLSDNVILLVAGLPLKIKGNLL